MDVKLGDYVTVVSNYTGHHLKKGETVRVIGFYERGVSAETLDGNDFALLLYRDIRPLMRVIKGGA